MDAIATLVKQTLATADDAARRKLLDTLQDLTGQLETEQDIMQRVHYSSLQLPVVRIGCDIKLFNILAESDTPLTVDQLAQKTGVTPLLMGRICRFLAAYRYIAEADQDLFTANRTSRLLTIPGIVGGVYHNQDTTGPAINALPDFLKKNKYENINDFVNTPLQVAHNTDLPGFIWAATQPEKFLNFSLYMTEQYSGLPTWLDKYPMQDVVKGLDPARPLFIDVGGGMGHQSVFLRTKFGDVPNDIVVQDMEMVLSQAIQHPGVKTKPIDFWTEQPVSGAKIYYLRQIIHDYPDEKALVILANVKAAMSPDSVILIDEVVVPNKGAHSHATHIDITMMSCLGSLERTHDQWYALIEKAGLKINKIYTYTATIQNSILECVAA